MISFQALNHYSFVTNFLVGLLFFTAIYGLGDLLVRGFRFHFPSPLRQISKTVLGFLALSLVVQLLSFSFWINTYSIIGINLLMGFALIMFLYRLFHSKVRLVSRFKMVWKEEKMMVIGVYISFFPLVFYAVLPSTKIDELFYHQLVAQRILSDGGLVFYRQPWEAAIPPHLIYNFTHVPLAALGFPDAPNVVSLGIFTIFLGSVYLLLKKTNVTGFWLGTALGLACLGMYRLVFTTAGSHHFGDLAAFAALYCTLSFSPLKKDSANTSLVAVQGIMLPALFGAKMSLAPFAALIVLVTIYDLYQRKEVTLKIVTLLLLPTFIFYAPIVIWTYVQTHSPFGLILSEYFNTQIIDSHLLDATLKAEIVTTPTFLEHLRGAVLHFPYLLLSSFVFFGFSNYPLVTKIKIYGICLLYLFILYKFHLLYNPRFWGNLPLSLFIFSLLARPNYPSFTTLFYKNRIYSKVTKALFTIVTVVPYMAMSYFYLYNLLPFPYNSINRELYYKKFIPLYNDYQALDKILPKDACIYTQERVSMIHSPRRIFRDSLDVCRCGAIYAMQFDTISLPSRIRMQQKNYTIDRLIYQNNHAFLKIYRTPNLSPQTNILSVYELRSIIP